VARYAAILKAGRRAGDRFNLGTDIEEAFAGHIAETTNAIVNSPIAVSNTLWHQRAITLSISSLLQVSDAAN
jgi:hypothetical protein